MAEICLSLKVLSLTATANRIYRPDGQAERHGQHARTASQLGTIAYNPYFDPNTRCSNSVVRLAGFCRMAASSKAR